MIGSFVAHLNELTSNFLTEALFILDIKWCQDLTSAQKSNSIDNHSYLDLDYGTIMSLLSLSNMPKNTPLRVISLTENPAFGELDRVISRRLTDLGFLPGAELSIISKGLLGKGPFAIRLDNNAQFSLRSGEAEKIICKNF